MIGFGTPGYAAYVPIYAGGGSLPAAFSERSPDPNTDSAWWLFRRLQRTADGNYQEAYPQIRTAWDAHLAKTRKSTRKVERAALALLKRGKADNAAQLLSEHSLEQGQKALHHARRLLLSSTPQPAGPPPR